MLVAQICFPIFSSNNVGEKVLADALANVEEGILSDTSKMTDEELVSMISETETNNPKLVAVREEIAEVFDENTELDIQVLNNEQIETFENLIEVVVDDTAFPTQEDAQDVKSVLMDFFNSESNLYKDIEATSEEMIDRIDENHSSIFDPISGEDVFAASRGWLSVWVLSVATNLAINFVIGGIGGSLMGAIRKYGVNWVRNTFKSRVKARLTRVGLGIVARYYGVVWEFVMAAWDSGTAFAKWVDRRDKIRNNGWSYGK